MENRMDKNPATLPASGNGFKRFFRICLILILGLFGLAEISEAATYYVDYQGGNDLNTGLSASSPWRHCPGDISATGNAATTNLVGGDAVIFKRGVTYTGDTSSAPIITPSSSGSKVTENSTNGTRIISGSGQLYDSGRNFVGLGVTPGNWVYIYHSKNSRDNTWVESVGLWQVASLDDANHITLSGFNGRGYAGGDLTYVITNPITFKSIPNWGTGEFATIDAKNIHHTIFETNDKSYLYFSGLRLVNTAYGDYKAAINNSQGYAGHHVYVDACRFENMGASAIRTYDGTHNIIRNSYFEHIGYTVQDWDGFYSLADNNTAKTVCRFGGGNKYWIFRYNTVDGVGEDPETGIDVCDSHVGHAHLFQIANNPNYDYGWIIGNRISRAAMNIYFTSNEARVNNATQTNPVVVTLDRDVPWNNGTQVCFFGVLGMEELNGHCFLIANRNGATFQLHNLDGSNTDGSGFGTFIPQSNPNYAMVDTPGHPAYWTIINNVVIGDYSLPGGGGVEAFTFGAGENIRIYNNTIVSVNGSMGFIFDVIISGISKNLDFKNNIFYSTNPNGTLAILIEKSPWVLGGFTFQNNHYNTNSSTPFRICYSQASETNQTLEQWQAVGFDNVGFHASNGLTVDPLFVSYTGNDFHLQPNSPDKDTGTSLTDYFILDKDKIMRPQGSGWDIGAYEYSQGPDNTPPAAPSGLTVK